MWTGVRTDPDAPKHKGISLLIIDTDAPGITVSPLWTIIGERTNDVFFDDVFVPDTHVVGELNKGFQYISSALDLERFTMFTFSPMQQRLDVLCDYVRETSVDGEPLKDDPVIRSRIAQLVTQAEVARVLGLRVVDASVKSEKSGAAPPTVESSVYKLYATEFSRRTGTPSAPSGPSPFSSVKKIQLLFSRISARPSAGFSRI